jgi:uncharacterized membrane protein
MRLRNADLDNRRDAMRRVAAGDFEMSVLIVGLLIFLGVHSTRFLASAWRARVIAGRGEGVWKGGFSLVSALGLILIVWGFGLARQAPVDLWQTPAWTRHVAALAMLVSFILLTAAYVPGNRIKAQLHHPMILGIKVWALAHLLANHKLGDVVLFGAFLVWAVLAFRAARQRDRVEARVYPQGTAAATAITVVVGAVAFVGFAFWGHAALIGVRPFG